MHAPKQVPFVHSSQGSVTYEVFQCSGWGRVLFPALCGYWVIVISNPFEWFFPWFWVVYLHAYADQYTQGGPSTDDQRALSAALPSPGFCCADSGFLSLSGPSISRRESRQELPQAVSWSCCRVLLVCFLCFQGSLSFPVSVSWSCCCTYLAVLGVVSGGRVNLVSVFPLSLKRIPGECFWIAEWVCRHLWKCSLRHYTSMHTLGSSQTPPQLWSQLIIHTLVDMLFCMLDSFHSCWLPSHMVDSSGCSCTHSLPRVWRLFLRSWEVQGRSHYYRGEWSLLYGCVRLPPTPHLPKPLA